MKRPRFFREVHLTIGDLVALEDADARHLRKVLRMRAGEEIILSDGAGKSFIAVLERVDRSGVSCALTQQLPDAAAPATRITLVQALPKGDKMDLIVQKGTELGLHSIIPLLSERSLVLLTETKLRQRRERWQRIAREAAKQCRRAVVPLVGAPVTWAGALAEMPPAVCALLPWEDETTTTLKDFLNERPAPAEVYCFIGPEGGFSEAEVAEGRKFGLQPVSLGPRILRTETAGLAVAALLLYQWGDLGGV